MSVKNKAYKSCVQPLMEYASTCWAPTSNKLSNSLEMVHHNGAKFVANKYPKKNQYHNFSITKVMHDLNWNSLEERRNQSRLVMTYKIINDQLILNSSLMPRTVHSRPPRLCNEVIVGKSNQLAEPQARLDVSKSTFFYSAPRIWNNVVTPLQANATSLDAFKHYFNK